MTYRVVFSGGAAAQYHDLPVIAQDLVVARAVELAEEPWDATSSRRGDDSNLREAIFGNGLGLIGFHVNGDDQSVRISNIVWTG
ncbi:hypothetical protein GCM10011575_33340 [Microlunatus endophyticus]|uniref:Uncharacterized protein n=1 Tax=Microlunatus endophyticus TaxID=1716077 RepID=A0A917W731_9ACTN|nr:hypothetical protein [Microlunatus endophyticus]GGL72331.1 hypothetical protein GCM10011575_33340 [Microlunatus endophyticus]